MCIHVHLKLSCTQEHCITEIPRALQHSWRAGSVYIQQMMCNTGSIVSMNRVVTAVCVRYNRSQIGQSLCVCLLCTVAGYCDRNQLSTTCT